MPSTPPGSTALTKCVESSVVGLGQFRRALALESLTADGALIGCLVPPPGTTGPLPLGVFFYCSPLL